MHTKETGQLCSTSSAHNKVALVTGANQGVGFQIAKALADNGYTVYVGSRNPDNGAAAVGKIGGKARPIQIDVTDKDSVTKAATTVQADFGYLSLLVNNAGISNAGKPGRTIEEIIGANRPSVASVVPALAGSEYQNVIAALEYRTSIIPIFGTCQLLPEPPGY